jgi:hypothetical protein
VEAAYWLATEFHVCLRFIFHERSLGIVLRWNGKDHWCLDENPVVSFGVRDETLVIITILTWCCTRIQGVIPACTSIQSESNQQVSPVRRKCWESVKRVGECVLCFEVHLSKLCLLTLKEIQSFWAFLVICVCFETYNLWHVIIILLADVQWHWWRDSCSHCWRLCSMSQEEGLWSVVISTWPIYWGPSWKTPCSKVYIWQKFLTTIRVSIAEPVLYVESGGWASWLDRQDAVEGSSVEVHVRGSSVDPGGWRPESIRLSMLR